MRQNRHSSTFALLGKTDTAFFVGWAGYGPKFKRGYRYGWVGLQACCDGYGLVWVIEMWDGTFLVRMVCKMGAPVVNVNAMRGPHF